MKKKIRIIIVMMVISLYSCFAGEIDINSEKTQTEIEVFKQTYQDEIDKTIETESPYPSSEGGSVEYSYDKDNNLLFFHAGLYGEMGQVNWKCYFVKDNLYYFEKMTTHYNQPMYLKFFPDPLITTEPFKILSEEVMPVIFFNDESYLLNKENNLWEKTDNDEYHTTLTELLDNVDKPDFDKSSYSGKQGVE